ncbi:MAG: hypothetical protein JXB05_21760 [Myxococcaceae bacterium]|nr:hypothetical protein [Myxococcaceae bacterium]
MRTARLVSIATPVEAPAALAAVCELPEEDVRPGGTRVQEDAGLLLPEVVWLEGLEGVGDAGARAWLEYLAASSRYGIAGALVLLMPVGRLSPKIEVPGTSPRLAVHRLSGTPSALEVRLLCRLAEPHPPTSPEALWREAVLPALVGSDLTLACALWEAVLEEEATLRSALTSAARACRWEAPALEEVRAFLADTGSSRGGGAQAAVETRWARLSQAGFAGTTPEYGNEVGTAALAAREEVRAVAHRLWRGQAALLLPRLDELRMRVCESLTRVYGPRWPLRWGRFEDAEDRQRVEDDPLACDYGPLEHILRKREVNGARYLPAVSLGRTLRNELAHYRPVRFTDFKRLCELEAHLR